MYFWMTKEQLFSLNFYLQAFMDPYNNPPLVGFYASTSLSLSMSLFWLVRHKESYKFLIGLSCDGFFYWSYFEGLYFYFLSFFFPLFYCYFEFVWVNFFLCIWSKKDISIFSRVSRESNISMPLPLFNPVGFRSHK